MTPWRADGIQSRAVMRASGDGAQDVREISASPISLARSRHRRAPRPRGVAAIPPPLPRLAPMPVGSLGQSRGYVKDQRAPLRADKTGSRPEFGRPWHPRRSTSALPPATAFAEADGSCAASVPTLWPRHRRPNAPAQKCSATPGASGSISRTAPSDLPRRRAISLEASPWT